MPRTEHCPTRGVLGGGLSACEHAQRDIAAQRSQISHGHGQGFFQTALGLCVQDHGCAHSVSVAAQRSQMSRGSRPQRRATYAASAQCSAAARRSTSAATCPRAHGLGFTAPAHIHQGSMPTRMDQGSGMVHAVVAAQNLILNTCCHHLPWNVTPMPSHADTQLPYPSQGLSQHQLACAPFVGPPRGPPGAARRRRLLPLPNYLKPYP